MFVVPVRFFCATLVQIEPVRQGSGAFNQRLACRSLGRSCLLLGLASNAVLLPAKCQARDSAPAIVNPRDILPCGTRGAGSRKLFAVDGLGSI
jgi:hypothetical protein